MQRERQPYGIRPSAGHTEYSKFGGKTMIYRILLLISAVYTVRLGWRTWRNKNRFGAVGLWLLALGILIGSFWLDFSR
jgi:hypothetical protein